MNTSVPLGGRPKSHCRRSLRVVQGSAMAILEYNLLLHTEHSLGNANIEQVPHFLGLDTEILGHRLVFPRIHSVIHRAEVTLWSPDSRFSYFTMLFQRMTDCE